MSDGAAAGRARTHRALVRRRSPSPLARARADAQGRTRVNFLTGLGAAVDARSRLHQHAARRRDSTFRTAAQLLDASTCLQQQAVGRPVRGINPGRVWHLGYCVRG